MSNFVLVTPLNITSGAPKPQLLVGAGTILKISVGVPIQPPTPSPTAPKNQFPPPTPPQIPPVITNSLITFSSGDTIVVAESLSEIQSQG